MKRALPLMMLLLTVGMLSAQENTKQTFTRTVLIEQFTTVNCGWCPYGAERITDAIGSNSNVIWIKHHAGFGTDFLTNDIHSAMLVFYGGSTFAPAMMVDRTRFNSGDDGPVGSVGTVTEIRSLLFDARQVTTYCKIYPVEATFDLSTNTVSGQVRGRFGEDNRWDENTRLTIFLIEDSIVGQQHDYTDHGNWNDYVHMGTVRDALTNMWGDPLTVDPSDRTFAYSFSKALPSGCNYHHCKLVAFIYQYNANDINDCPVLNAAQSPFFGDVLGIAETECGSTLRLYPNPTVDHVVLEADEAIAEVRVTDMLGREVYAAQGTGSNWLSVDTHTLPQGIYLVHIRTAAGTSTRQMSVVRN